MSESLTAGPVCKSVMTLCSGPSSKRHSEGEARLGLLTSGNQNKKLKLASWGQKPGKILGNTEIRLGKDTEGKCFGCFQTAEDDSQVANMNSLPGDSDLVLIFDLNQ